MSCSALHDLLNDIFSDDDPSDGAVEALMDRLRHGRCTKPDCKGCKAKREFSLANNRPKLIRAAGVAGRLEHMVRILGEELPQTLAEQFADYMQTWPGDEVTGLETIRSVSKDDTEIARQQIITEACYNAAITMTLRQLCRIADIEPSEESFKTINKFLNQYTKGILQKCITSLLMNDQV